MILLDTDDGTYHELNEIAAFVWMLLERTALSVSEISEQVCGEFEVDKSECETDMDLLLKQLVDEKLVEIII